MDYDQTIAFHYAAYRPPLHAHILSEHLDAGVIKPLGIDIGAGTGHSAIALAHFCEKVIGLEPSQAMIDAAIPHPKVAYTLYNGAAFGIADDSGDIITFAGSLFYAKSQMLLDEVVRVSKPDAMVLVYDFEVLLQDILAMLSVGKTPKKPMPYNHQEDFSGLDQSAIKIDGQYTKSVSLDIAMPDLAHLLLSDENNCDLLMEVLGPDDLHAKVTQKLSASLKAESASTQAMTYQTVYKVTK